MGSSTGRRSSFVRPAAVRRALLAWYDREQRDLPWRRTADPYRIWVSEVMLQQTRVAVVVAAYDRFVSRFPSIEALAAASEDDVLAVWSGLGYYSRARALHRAARLLDQRGAAFPSNYAEAMELPGVGRYTAAAVLSIAYGRPHAAVDGNVIRVLSRLFRLGLPDSRGQPHASYAEELLDGSRPGDWNQAVMELGATVCTPRDPDCGRCPLASKCLARAAGVVDRHPPPKRRRSTEKVHLTMLVLRDRRGRVLLERGVFRYLPEMWLPLVLDGDDPIAREEPAAEISHAITHRSFRIRVVCRNGAAAPATAGGGERRWFGKSGLGEIPRSSLLDKALAVDSPVRPSTGGTTAYPRGSS